MPKLRLFRRARELHTKFGGPCTFYERCCFCDGLMGVSVEIWAVPDLPSWRCQELMGRAHEECIPLSERARKIADVLSPLASATIAL